MADPAQPSLEEFKARLPLVEIVARYVRLSRRGREHTGLCPFHQEKTPSFTVSEAKGFYHCFGCGQHGNAIDFIMAIEGLDFGQALTRLADLTGLPAPRRAADGRPAADPSLYAANDAAARWFAGRLESAAGAEARAYLAGRGLDTATIARFGLGYAPQARDALKRALLAEGFGESTLLEAGLLARPEDAEASFDRFRHRIMFPIHDRRGRIVGFGGRALGEARAKYLNTPETPLFRKGELLYGLGLARTAVRERGTVIVAEGYMDVIALARAGFVHAVAPLGTAVTEAQLTALWQLADEPVLCLDSDEAGLRAGARLIERALPLLRPGKSLRFALLPQGADPDEVLRIWGRQRLAQTLGEARPLIEFLWDSETRQRSFATPERRAALRQRLIELCGTIAEPALRQMFRDALEQRMAARFGRARGPARGRVAASPWPRGESGVGVARLQARIANPARAAEAELLGPIIIHPQLLDEIEEEFATLEFSEPELARLHDGIISWYGERGHLDLTGLKDHLCATGFAGLIEQLALEDLEARWYRRPGLGLAELLEGWRSRAAQLHRFAARRAAGQAAAEAIAGQRVGEAGRYRVAVDRLINESLHQRAKNAGKP